MFEVRAVISHHLIRPTAFNLTQRARHPGETSSQSPFLFLQQQISLQAKLLNGLYSSFTGFIQPRTKSLSPPEKAFCCIIEALDMNAHRGPPQDPEPFTDKCILTILYCQTAGRHHPTNQAVSSFPTSPWDSYLQFRCNNTLPSPSVNNQISPLLRVIGSL